SLVFFSVWEYGRGKTLAQEMFQLPRILPRMSCLRLAITSRFLRRIRRRSQLFLAFRNSIATAIPIRRRWALALSPERIQKMKQLILALVTVIASLGVAEQASAFYAAHLGRFVSRDPAGEMGRFGGGVSPDSGVA